MVVIYSHIVAIICYDIHGNMHCSCFLDNVMATSHIDIKTFLAAIRARV